MPQRGLSTLELKERGSRRWRKQHKEIRLYLKRKEYEVLEKLASEQGMTVKDFVDNPFGFRARVRGYKTQLYEGDIALFEVSCMYCEELMVFTHKDGNWKSE